MRFTGFIFVCFSIVILASVLGCASLGGGQVSINWALAKNGGQVSAFSEEFNHPASKLVNGITSSEGWNQGEGWEAGISVTPGGGRSAAGKKLERERNWVIIELSQPIAVNHVIIHTIDSEEYPARDFAVKSLALQYEFETASRDMIWANVDKYGKGVGDQSNEIKDNISDVINIRFRSVNTRKIRLLIYSTNDLKKVKASGGARQGTIRLTEIQVYGMGKLEKRDELEAMFE